MRFPCSVLGRIYTFGWKNACRCLNVKFLKNVNWGGVIFMHIFA